MLGEHNQAIDERISKGLAVILSSSDKKIDKGLAALGDMKKGVQVNGGTGEPSPELSAHLAKIDKAVQALHIQLQEVASRRLPPVELPKDLEVRLDALEKGSQAVEMQLLDKLAAMEQRQVKEKDEKAAPPQDLVLKLQEMRTILDRLSHSVAVVDELREKIARIDQRVSRVEEAIQKLPGPRQRTLKQKEA